MKNESNLEKRERNESNIYYFIHDVVGCIYRPRNGHELLQLLKENKKCEVVDSHAFIAYKALDDNGCGFSLSFKKSNWSKGWTSFERF